MDDYFTSLGRSMAAEIARNPATMARLRGAADHSLVRHLAGPRMARDAMPALAPYGNLGGDTMNRRTRRVTRDQDPSDMPPRGSTGSPDDDDNGQYQNGDPSNGDVPAGLTPEMVLQAVGEALDRFDDAQKATLLSGLALIADSGDTSGLPAGGNGSPINGDNYGSTMDGRRGNGMDGRGGRRSRAAMDAAFAKSRTLEHSQDFARRFPDAAKVRMQGTR